ncbi:MAG: cysteine desulfurase [bacterium]|nr:cysteine desulfurase [bacterium]
MNRDDFPILKNNLIYFDNGATTLKPKCVVDKMVSYYTEYTSNIHRGDYNNATVTNREYDEVRNIVKNFINASSSDEIIYTSGTTESLNMVAFGFFRYKLNSDDEILITKAEHASNILPWQVLEEEHHGKVKYIELDENHELTIENLLKAITPKTKVVSVAHVSNVIGDIRDISKIGRICKEKGIYFVVDAAQSASHIKIDVQDSNVSFLAFSAHKMTGPTGVGILYGKKELLDEMRPLKYGGGMNQSFEVDGTYILKETPIKFEAGTPPIAEVIGLGEAIKFIESIGVDKIHEHEYGLKKYLIENLEKIPNVVLYNKNSKSGIVSFNVKGVFPQDTSIYLNTYNIAIRAGNHCAKVLKDELNIKNTCRVSLYLYNTKEEVDVLIEALKRSEDIFKVVI